MAQIRIAQLVKGVVEGKINCISVAFAAEAIPLQDEFRTRLMQKLQLAAPVVGDANVVISVLNFMVTFSPSIAAARTIDDIVRSVADELNIMLSIGADLTVEMARATPPGRPYETIVIVIEDPTEQTEGAP